MEAIGVIREVGETVERPLDSDILSPAPEMYARSLRALKYLGSIALEAGKDVSDHEDAQEAWQDFTTAAGENLATDAEYGDRLVFNPMRPYKRINGHAVDSKGRTIVDMVQAGRRASLQAAIDEPEMVIQAERDDGDVEVAQIVDSLKEGEMYAVVCMDPKDALQTNPDYWRIRGYREGMAVLQVYYHSSNGQILAGAYSIKDSDKDMLRHLQAEDGVDIPETETDSRWIKHGLRRSVSDDEAMRFGDEFIRRYRDSIGDSSTKVSVTDIIRDHQGLAKRYFNEFIAPLAYSHEQNVPDTRIQQLATSIMQTSVRHSPEEMHSLLRVSNGLVPTEQDTIFLEERIRFAFVEEVRKYIPSYVTRVEQTSTAATDRVASTLNSVAMHIPIYEQELLRQVTENITSGTQAKRTYGGCSGVGNNENLLSQDGINERGAEQQDVFGGKGNLPDDKYGSRYFKCPKKGCTNVRPKDKLIPKCQKCGADVMCK